MNRNDNRSTFSNFGFLVSAVGSAVGLGILWKFPYVTGMNGGGIFVLIYLIIALVIGVVCTMGEMIIGRHTKLNPIGAYQKIAKKFTFVGVIGVVLAFLIVTYYNIIGGWVLKYLFSYIIGQGSVIAFDPETFYHQFIANPYQPIFWMLAFSVMNQLIISRGIAEGLEKANKIIMPVLFFIVIALAIRSCTLPGAVEGIKFMLMPDVSKFSLDTISQALGQVFFTMSLGMGIMITYGSYLSNEAPIERMTLTVIGFDVFAAIVAGLVILPAVFAFDLDPAQGPGLIFMTLPKVFEATPGGDLIAVLFFALVLFAGVSSALSLLEVPIAYLIDNRGWGRKRATLVIAVAVFLIGIPESLSLGVWKHQFFGFAFFDLVGYIAENLMMPVAGLLMCVVLGHFWPMEKQIEEVEQDGRHPFVLKPLYMMSIRYIAPVAIFLIWLNSSGILGLFLK